MSRSGNRSSGSMSLKEYIQYCDLRWLLRVLRVPNYRLLRQALFSSPNSKWWRPRDGRNSTWQKGMKDIMKHLETPVLPSFNLIKRLYVLSLLHRLYCMLETRFWDAITVAKLITPSPSKHIRLRNSGDAKATAVGYDVVVSVVPSWNSSANCENSRTEQKVGEVLAPSVCYTFMVYRCLHARLHGNATKKGSSGIRDALRSFGPMAVSACDDGHLKVLSFTSAGLCGVFAKYGNVIQAHSTHQCNGGGYHLWHLVVTDCDGVGGGTTAEHIFDDSVICLQSVIIKLYLQTDGFVLPNNTSLTATKASRPCVEDKFAGFSQSEWGWRRKTLRRDSWIDTQYRESSFSGQFCPCRSAAIAHRKSYNCSRLVDLRCLLLAQVTPSQRKRMDDEIAVPFGYPYFNFTSTMNSLQRIRTQQIKFLHWSHARDVPRMPLITSQSSLIGLRCLGNHKKADRRDLSVKYPCAIKFDPTVSQ
ncbi:hypothetical protein CLF_103588 [Clonorchis sinensis]|uniref:Uncharacterized protein n=1 Tax=Clonorchis sinensis TaxID=79923 RepID=G7Y9Z6_CLOSI|nr:hypothetical protein CLF_103588 [Clonorchis sinensis]